MILAPGEHRTIQILTLVSALIFSGPALAGRMICTIQPANEVLDHLQSIQKEIPVLRMTLAGDIQAILTATPDGKFTLMGLRPDGTACIFAIGDNMKVVSSNYRFLKETAE